jgi:hypothetical protein
MCNILRNQLHTLAQKMRPATPLGASRTVYVEHAPSLESSFLLYSSRKSNHTISFPGTPDEVATLSNPFLIPGLRTLMALMALGEADSGTDLLEFVEADVDVAR